MTNSNDLLIRIADFHLGALVLLTSSAIVSAWSRQPARRIAIAWATVGGLALLLALSAVPGRTVLHLSPGEQATAVSSPQTTVEISEKRPQRAPERIETFRPAGKYATAGISTIATRATALDTPIEESGWPVDAIVVVCTLAGSCLAIAWLFIGGLAGWRLVRAAQPAGTAHRQILMALLNGYPVPRLLVSSQLSTAVAIGLLRPTIVLPKRLALNSGAAELRSVLAHELGHLRGRDLWLLAAFRLLLIVLWPNPLYWLTRYRVRNDQETLADAAAADLTNRQAYAEQLVVWARTLGREPSRSQLFGAAGLWEGRSQLRKRVAVLLDESFTVVRKAGVKCRLLCGVLCAVVAVLLSLLSVGPGENPVVAADVANLTTLGVEQEMLPLRVRVVDEQGAAVPMAKVSPWALRCSQGHGWWGKDDREAGVDPEAVLTDENGTATVLYPRYRLLSERVSTNLVSLSVDHPTFAYQDDLHIDVPLEPDGPHQITLKRGVIAEIRPTINGATPDNDRLFAFWSDGRSWQPGVKPESTADGMLRIPAMPPGPNSVLLARLDEDRVTHFSDLVEFELTPGEPAQIDVMLRPALTVRGVLSNNVPRPIKNGRLKVRTLAPESGANRVGWFTWVPIGPDGTFTIESWPRGERLQIIALCDGYIASSGKPPEVVANPRSPGEDPYLRPQVFKPSDGERVEVAMTPLVPCVATTVDEDGEPVAGIKVVSWPNVGWWNDGSQIYCHRLVRGERLLRERKYDNSIDEVFPHPFESETGADGRVVLHLPEGTEHLAILSEVYESPIVLGRRQLSVDLVRGETTFVTLHLQPRGTEELGEWDKLAGVVFGCSTREGRRICALPGVLERMQELTRRFRETTNQQDPKLLSETYSAVADAFAGVGDAEEALKWRLKAAQQSAKADEQ